MAADMSVAALRDAMRNPQGRDPFQLVQQIARLVSNERTRVAGQEMILRALEHREVFSSVTEVLDALVRAVGLFPYLDEDVLGFRDTVAYEMHRPENMAEDFVFHHEQAEVFYRLLNGDSVILSAPTSFGKSRIIDALVASGRFRNIAVIVPTLALIDETRRRLASFSNEYKIVTHLTQDPAQLKNIFVFTAERAVGYERFPKIDFFVLDEFYKIDTMNEDETRTVALNQVFYKMRKHKAQFYLLGPSIDHIPEGVEDHYRCTFYHSKYNTVVSEHIDVPRDGSDIERLIHLSHELSEPTLIFCRSPARVNEVARALIESELGDALPRLDPAVNWIRANYHKDWIMPNALSYGIGIHHGRLPRAIAQFVVRKFNNYEIRFLICTSTLIEGVNTKAKNVIVFDNQIARRHIDFFTFNNIRGRSGRMFEHFVGNVYLFEDPPQEELPFVDFPLFTQDADTPESLLVQIDDEDLEPHSRERVQKYQDQGLLPMAVLRLNATIDPDAQVRLAQKLRADPVRWSHSLGWTGFPSKAQLDEVCGLIWEFLAKATRGRASVRSDKQLAFKIRQLHQIPDVTRRIHAELRPHPQAAKTADEAVERVLEFERTWAGFEFPRYLMALCRIQQAVFQRLGLPSGDYSMYAAQVENLFRPPVVTCLDEYGIPPQVGLKLSKVLGEGNDLDIALRNLKHINLSGLHLDEFELELVNDAKDGI